MIDCDVMCLTASIVGGTMFALAMMMLVGILLIMVVEKRKARKRQEAMAKSCSRTSLPNLESQATTPKVNDLTSLERAKAERRNLYKMYRAQSNGGFSSDGEKYEGIYRKGRYWDKATETDTSSIEGDTRTNMVYEEYSSNARESTTDPPTTDPNGNITGEKSIFVNDKNSNVVSCPKRVGFHLNREKRHQRNKSRNVYETAVSVNDSGKETTDNSPHKHPGITGENEVNTDSNTYDSVYTEKNNNEVNLKAATSSESLTTVSNIDGHSSIYCSNNSMFASNASLGSLWEERSRGSTALAKPTTKEPISTSSPRISNMISQFEAVTSSLQEKDSGRDGQYETAKAYWKSRGRGGKAGDARRPSGSLTRKKPGGEGGGKDPPTTMPKPGTVRSSPAAKVKQSPNQKVRSSPASRARASPSSKTRRSPAQQPRDGSVLQRRPSPRASPAKSRSSSRSRSPHSTRSGESPRSGGRKSGYEDQKPGQYHAEEPELSSYSIYYSRSDFKRSLPNFNSNSTRRPMTKPPPPPTHPPPKPTTQKPCLKPKPGLKRSDPVRRSTEDMFKCKKDKSAGKKSKSNHYTSNPSVYIYDGGASLGGSYRSLNSLDTVDQGNAQSPSHTEGQANGQSNAQSNGQSNGHYESYSNGLHIRSDDDLEIVDNVLYPSTDFNT